MSKHRRLRNLHRSVLVEMVRNDSARYSRILDASYKITVLGMFRQRFSGKPTTVPPNTVIIRAVDFMTGKRRVTYFAIHEAILSTEIRILITDGSKIHWNCYCEKYKNQSELPEVMERTVKYHARHRQTDNRTSALASP